MPFGLRQDICPFFCNRLKNIKKITIFWTHPNFFRKFDPKSLSIHRQVHYVWNVKDKKMSMFRDTDLIQHNKQLFIKDHGCQAAHIPLTRISRLTSPYTVTNSKMLTSNATIKIPMPCGWEQFWWRLTFGVYKVIFPCTKKIKKNCELTQYKFTMEQRLLFVHVRKLTFKENEFQNTLTFACKVFQEIVLFILEFPRK